ncbi:MAG TPA: TAXI family TRAP transporter solute-binding subunit [bacterium]|jgi:hypothetical protein
MKSKIVLAALTSAALALGVAWSPASAMEIRWGTSAVGSTGHRSVTTLVEVLKKEFPQHSFTVQPTPGAILTVKGYAMGQFEGYYGADIAFYELSTGTNRFVGFKEQMKREPVQSFWTYTVEVGVAIHSRDIGKINQWSDLAGKRVFTGPRPWDVRAYLERALRTAGVDFEYIEVGLDAAGSLLDSGRYSGMLIYTNAEATTAPWITEASIQTDWATLNPSPAEIAALSNSGFRVIDVDAKAFGKKEIHVPKAKLLPFYYGFHVGLEVPEQDVYQMLKAIEKNATALAKADPGFQQIVDDMVGMQRKGVEAAVAYVPVHPGLARYMREKGVWDAKWDSRIAKPR